MFDGLNPKGRQQAFSQEQRVHCKPRAGQTGSTSGPADKSIFQEVAIIWVWVKIKPPGDRRFWSMFPLTRVPFGVPIFDPLPFHCLLGVAVEPRFASNGSRYSPRGFECLARFAFRNLKCAWIPACDECIPSPISPNPAFIAVFDCFPGYIIVRLAYQD